MSTAGTRSWGCDLPRALAHDHAPSLSPDTGRSRSKIKIKSMSRSVGSELRQLLGDAAVADDAETLTAHAGDKWFAAHNPEVVVFAESTAQVSALLRFASEHNIPVTARGAGYG